MHMNVIRKVLSAEDLAKVMARLAPCGWVSGLETAGAQAAEVKRNLQLAADSPEANELGELVKKSVLAHPRFTPLALPRRMSLPMVSRYEVGMEYGAHTDNALRTGRDGLRTDLAATLFLSSPDSYEGGALSIGGSSLRLPAGDLVLYPATSVHRVTPVTRGVRLAAVFWVQSLIRSHEQREVLLTLHDTLESLAGHPSAVNVAGVQQNLLRMWAEH
jgi:PKHD-type hydroxylase